jgi:hypothetical protein
MPEATPFAGRVGANLNHHRCRDGRVFEVGAAGQAADDPWQLVKRIRIAPVLVNAGRSGIRR